MIVQTNIGLESHGIGTSIVNQLTTNAIGEKNRIIASDCRFLIYLLLLGLSKACVYCLAKIVSPSRASH
jgi:hypothetical protein